MTKKIKNLLLSLGTTTTVLSGMAFAISCGDKTQTTSEDKSKIGETYTFESESKFTTSTESFKDYTFEFEKEKVSSTEFVISLYLKDKTGKYVSYTDASKNFSLELKELEANGNVKTSGKTFTTTSTFVGAQEKTVEGKTVKGQFSDTAQTNDKKASVTIPTRTLSVPVHYEFKFTKLADENRTLNLESLAISSFKFDQTAIELKK